MLSRTGVPIDRFHFIVEWGTESMSSVGIIPGHLTITDVVWVFRIWERANHGRQESEVIPVVKPMGWYSYFQGL